MKASVFSVDLPWGASTRARTAIAAWSPAAGITIVAVNDADELVASIAERAARGALVLLDIPIEGCAGLGPSCPRRQVDDRLSRVGIPVLPSAKAGQRGITLRDRLRAARADLRVMESYPYAVLRVLWALREEGLPVQLAHDPERHRLRWKSWWRWPPRYKRAPRAAERRAALAAVAAVLRASGRDYAAAVRPPDRAAGMDLARLSDEYDALLGLVAARAAHDASAWAWPAHVPSEPGSILTLGPAWLRRAFEQAGAPVRATPRP